MADARTPRATSCGGGVVPMRAERRPRFGSAGPLRSRRGPASCSADARRDDQRTVGAFERRAERCDGALVLGAVLREFREVVIEGSVDHGIGLRRTRFEAVQILERTAMNVGACARRVPLPLWSDRVRPST